MKIFVNIKPRAKQEQVLKIDKNHFDVSVRESATQEKANNALVKILSQYFHTSPSCVTVLSGTKSRKKVVDVL